jgi:hypothetical protein
MNVLFMCLVNVVYVWTSNFCVEWMFSTCESLIFVISKCFLCVKVLFLSSVNVFYVWMSSLCVYWMFSTYERLIYVLGWMLSTCERLISVLSECFLRVKVFFLCLVSVFYVWRSYFRLQWMFSTCEGVIYLFCWVCWVCLPSCLIYILCGVLCNIHVKWWSCSPYIYS